MTGSGMINRVMNKLTPGRARIAVLLYGLKLFFTPARYRFFRIQNRINYRSFFDAFFRPRKSVWMTLLAPGELIRALGYTPIVMESVGGILGALGLTRMFLRNTVETGVPSSLCTFHRAHLSVVLKNGFYPPGRGVAVSALCDGNLRSMQEICGRYGSPFHFIDIPDPDSPGAEEFVRTQLEELFRKMGGEQEAGFSATSLAALRETVSYADAARLWRDRVNELRREKYFPRLKPMALAWGLLNYTAQFGSKGSADYYKALYRALDTKGAPIPGNRLRFLLMHLPPTYEHPVVDTIEEKGGIIAIEEFNTIPLPPLDPEDPFTSIAGRLLSVHLVGNPKKRIEHINSLIRDYEIDGVINFAHWGCRTSSGAISLMKSRIDAPLLSIETDLVDSESSSAGQIKTRVESFIEMLQGQTAKG
jgi:benzoyl-CoA reductase/2-hydroxyglutaryl-CoA dehydratase subunit BcrC/BadD/HgdB